MSKYVECYTHFNKAKELFDFYLKPLVGIIELDKGANYFFLDKLEQTIKQLKQLKKEIRAVLKSKV